MYIDCSVWIVELLFECWVVRCRVRLGQPGRRRLQLLPHHWLFCQVSSRQLYRRQIRTGWHRDSKPSGRHFAVAHPCLQRHAYERPGCHRHSWCAASAGLWKGRLSVSGERCLVF